MKHMRTRSSLSLTSELPAALRNRAEEIDIYMKMRRSDISSVDLVSSMSGVCFRSIIDSLTQYRS